MCESLGLNRVNITFTNYSVEVQRVQEPPVNTWTSKRPRVFSAVCCACACAEVGTSCTRPEDELRERPENHTLVSVAESNPSTADFPSWPERPRLSLQAEGPWRELVPEVRISAWIESAQLLPGR